MTAWPQCRCLQFEVELCKTEQQAVPSQSESDVRKTSTVLLYSDNSAGSVSVPASLGTCTSRTLTPNIVQCAGESGNTYVTHAHAKHRAVCRRVWEHVRHARSRQTSCSMPVSLGTCTSRTLTPNIVQYAGESGNMYVTHVHAKHRAVLA
jgi:hypothetical protein